MSAIITINSVTFAATPAVNQFGTISYRPCSTGPFVVADNNVEVLPNGNLVTPLIIAGLAEDTCYDVRFTNNCGGDGVTKQITTASGDCVGFPVGTLYAALFWSSGDIDISTDPMCEGEPIHVPAYQSAVAIAFFSDSALTTPVITNLNNFPITVGGTPYLIGDGTPNYAYFIDWFDHITNDPSEPDCVLVETVHPLPALSAGPCFDISEALEGLGNGQFTVERAAGDGTTWGYFADMRRAIVAPSGTILGDSGPTSAAVGAGSPGPNTNNANRACYSEVTVGLDTPAGQSLIVTIVGTANDGTTGETIVIPAAVFSTYDSAKKYMSDSNHPIVVTFDEQP